MMAKIASAMVMANRHIYVITAQNLSRARCYQESSYFINFCGSHVPRKNLLRDLLRALLSAPIAYWERHHGKRNSGGNIHKRL